jgi:hypothetical protein
MGLAATDVFFFGSAPGDAGAADDGAFSVTSADEISARSDPHGLGSLATISNPNDFNRDGFVNSADQIVSRNYTTSLIQQLNFLSVSSPTFSSTTSSLTVSPIEEATTSEPSPKGLRSTPTARTARSLGSTAIAVSFADDDWIASLADARGVA